MFRSFQVCDSSLKKKHFYIIVDIWNWKNTVMDDSAAAAAITIPFVDLENLGKLRFNIANKYFDMYTVYYILT